MECVPWLLMVLFVWNWVVIRIRLHAVYFISAVEFFSLRYL